MRAIISANLPYQVVENPDFRQLLQYLEADVELTSRQTLTRDLLTFYEDRKQQLIETLAHYTAKGGG